jgi:MFS transporter, Spinster family, sphingosine-1-phosphate transporter
LAIPVGSALGYLFGGLLGQHFGWRAAFFAVGFPGLLLAISMVFMREPERGAQDAPESRGRVAPLAAYKELLHNRVYLWTVLGYVAYTFAIGGLAFWMPSYLIRERGFAPASGMMLFGAITVVTGAVGTLVGGFIGDKLQARGPNGYTLLSVAAMLSGATCSLLAFLSGDTTMFLVLLSLAELFLFLNTGPINALIVNSVRPGVRATAAALCIFAIHIGGDAISPTLMGAVADGYGLGRSMLLIPIVFFLAGLLWLGTWHKERPVG